MTDRGERLAALQAAVAERVLVLDGAMGTMIQRYTLDEAAFRGERLAGHDIEVKGNNDLLNITRPQVIGEIHRAYLAAGADIIETNTFSSTTIAQADYHLEALARELNVAGARLAREAADEYAARDPTRPRWVAGALGPTNKTASLSPDVNDPGYRGVTFDELRAAYAEAARGLIEGGVDLLLVETVFDTLNAKAALFAIDEVFEELGERLPIMVSGTIADRSGRTLAGQTVEAFWNSIRHAQPFSVGLNCSLGAEQLRPYLADLGRVAETAISAYPNAGLPNEMGEYDEDPETTAGFMEEWAADGLVNIVGGCCGTTPEHVRRIAERVRGVAPRRASEQPRRLRLAGLDAFEVPA